MLTKQEVKDWINFLYSDLLRDDVLIGGYYFNFSQLSDFEKLEQDLNEKSSKILARYKAGGIEEYKNYKNSSNSLRKCAQIECFEKLDQLSVKLTTKNKYSEKITFPVMQNEFFYVYNELLEAKQDVDHFQDFLLEEVDIIKEEDGYEDFMVFINDLVKEMRQKFSGEKYSIIF